MASFLLHESIGKPRRQFSVTLRAFGKGERGRTKHCKVSSLWLETWAQLSVPSSDLGDTTEPQLAFILHLKMKMMLFLYPRPLVWVPMGGPLVRKRSCYRTSLRSISGNSKCKAHTSLVTLFRFISAKLISRLPQRGKQPLMDGFYFLASDVLNFR